MFRFHLNFPHLSCCANWLKTGSWLIAIAGSSLALSAQDSDDVSDIVEANSTLPAKEDANPGTNSQGLSYWESTVLGIVEGLTEYLPVSSTGHLILADHWMDAGRKGTEPGAFELSRAKEARNAYLVVIQGGAILAVVLLYWRKLWSILMGLLGRDKEGLQLGLKVLVAFIPAAMLGPLLDDWIESRLFNPTAVATALFLGAIIMFWVEWRRKKAQQVASEKTKIPLACEHDMAEMSYKGALFIGVMQCFAMWPGMSRSMMTIVGGYLAGLSAKAAAEFSFLLGLLTLSAASAYSLLKSWDVMVETLNPGPALVGVLVATVVAFLAVKWFVHYLTRHGLFVFAVYRLFLAALVLWFLR